MVNSFWGCRLRKYHKGRVFEYKVRDLLKSMGFTVFRCAASKPVDLIALKKGVPPILVECRSFRAPTRKRREELEQMAEKSGAVLLIAERGKLREFRREIEALLSGRLL